MENGGRERDRGSESDEDEDSEQNTSESGRPNGDSSSSLVISKCETNPLFLSAPGPGWTANFRDSGGNAASQTPAAWDTSAGGGTGTQETGWANFTQFQPFSG